MTAPWLAYLPPHLASDLLAHPAVSPLDRVLRQQAVALFADISGFTPMSEALGQVGPSGTEELSQILNQTFGAMIARFSAAGGSIGKFAGDALTILFPITARTRRATLRRAIQCALDMQADLAAAPTFATRAGTFTLAMKIGFGLGDLLTTTVGDETIRLEYLLAGRAIDQCAEAEQQASKGAVVVPEPLIGAVGRATTQPVTPGYQQVVRLHRRPAAAPLVPSPAPPPALVTTITRYLPPAIAERVATGQQGFIDEHRIVTTLFVQFQGFAYQERAVVPRLQTYLAAVVGVVARYGGYLRQVDVGDKGSLYIVLFGAPLAHEDDAERALLCALELRTLAQHNQIITATGITTGRVFCGLVGLDMRREYTAIGDSVNLAARLMSAAAPEQILVDAATQQTTKRTFTWKELAPLTVKGKSAPVAVAALERVPQRRRTRLRAPSYTLPMVGRQHEYGIGLASITRVLAGQSQVLLLSAEAGMGKSRLVAELMRSAEMKQLRPITSECLSYRIDSSYLVWHNLLRALFRLTPDMGADTQITQVRRVLGQFDPALLERMPLLSPILSLPFAESDFTRLLDAKLRKSALEVVVVECLRHFAEQQPLLLVLEDCHWIDALSEELLLAVAHGCREVALLLLLTARPRMYEAPGGRISGARLGQVAGVQELQLTEFTLEETAALIQLKLERLFGDTGSVPAALLERISSTAQGNPFYIDELLNLLHDRRIDLRDAAALAQLELPSSLQRLILSRIDALEEGPKSALKVGSVIGRLFKAHWLWAIYPALGESAQVVQYLSMLQQVDLTQLERAEPEVEYLFKHIITREVAYESLAVQTRSVLHEQVGAFIERTYADELEGWLDVLAYHYGHSSNVGKQQEYFEKAGRAAKTACSNEAARSYFMRLLAILPEQEQGPTLLALAEVEQLLWLWDAADGHARAALELAERLGDRLLRAQVARTYGALLSDIGRYEQALEVLAQARQVFTVLERDQDLADTLHNMTRVYFQQGNYAEVLATSETCIQLSSRIEYQLGYCNAINSLGIVAGEQGRYQEARAYFEQGLAVAEEHQLPTVIVALVGNLGAAYADMGDYQRSYAQHRRKLDLVVRLGIQEDCVLTLNNLGATYYTTGQYAYAQQCYYAALARMQIMEPRLLGDVLLRLAGITRKLGDGALVEALFGRAIAVCRAFAIRFWLVIALYEQAEHATDQQRYAAAQRSNDEALALATEWGIQRYQFQGSVLAIRLQALLGQIELPIALAQLNALRLHWSEPHQQAQIDVTIWKLDASQEAARAAAAARYRALYLKNSGFHYRERYQELTGEELPDPQLLPGPPPIVHQHTVDLPAFLVRVDALLAA